MEIDQASVIRRRDGSVIADGQAEPTFTTIELLECQQRIVSTVETGIGVGCGTVDAEIVEDTIVSADRLSVEQADLVRAWLTSGDRVQCAVGRAGTGKTTTMQAAADAWTVGGYRVLGAAVKGEAARQLADDAGIESETVAMLLARSDAGIRVLDSRTVLIVDEASTLGDRDLLRLCDLAVETGATLRLIGDTAQHGSVPAGGTFAELVDQLRRPHPAVVDGAATHRPGRAATSRPGPFRQGRRGPRRTRSERTTRAHRKRPRHPRRNARPLVHRTRCGKSPSDGPRPKPAAPRPQRSRPTDPDQRRRRRPPNAA